MIKSLKKAKKTDKLKENAEFQQLRNILGEEMLGDFCHKGYTRDDISEIIQIPAVPVEAG
ncbi:hypothetical protein STRDD11_01570 [Streptococcus sp. DD11]|nr:hypothetical protein STRDD11_01570 [Streptococcus sp. DD11]